MTVRDLIESLLDYDVDSEIEIELNSSGITEWVDFDVYEGLSNKEVYLTVDLSNRVLVDNKELGQMEDRLAELEEEQ